ncbi:MAG: hypothetical protein N4A40_09320 [Tissierellales bacterium]|nr:hypothetical protein [Tissierellales bacterium]
MISIIALYFTIRAFSLKAGQRFRCGYSVTSSIDCEDKYVSSIIVENLKDRAAIIFKIYIKFGLNNYLLVEDFSDSPLILKPFEVYYKEYEPILFYSLGSRLTRIDKLIDNKKVKSKILLTTSNGKYTVKSNTKQWDPIIPFFENHSTALIDPIRYRFKDKSYGSNVKFLIEVTTEKEEEYVISLYKDDYRHKRFSKFQLTKESLETKETLQRFLENQKKDGKFDYKKIDIISFEEEVNRVRSKYPEEVIHVESYNFFKYRIVAKILTIIDHYKMNKRNRQNRKKNKQRKNKQTTSQGNE